MISFYKEAYHVNGRTFDNLTTAITSRTGRASGIPLSPGELPDQPTVLAWRSCYPAGTSHLHYYGCILPEPARKKSLEETSTILCCSRSLRCKFSY